MKRAKVDSTGYCDCACRDCFEIAIATAAKPRPFCAACADAGCEGDAECCAEGAYGSEGA